MTENEVLIIPIMALRLFGAALIGGLTGFEQRMHHKAIGVAGMVLVAVGGATSMLLAKHLTTTDPSAVGRLLQGFFSSISFLGGAVIFKGGTDVRGIKTAAAIWTTGAIGLAIGTSLWWLGVLVGAMTGVVLFMADQFPGTQQKIEQEADEAKAKEKLFRCWHMHVACQLQPFERVNIRPKKGTNGFTQPFSICAHT